jgi:uncharacterized OsmC-like protein
MIAVVSDYEAVVAAGTLRGDSADAHFTHPWTAEGVTVETAFSGAHLLHLAAAGCVLNDVYREARRLEIPVDGVRVSAGGGFDTADWHSTGIEYAVELDSPADAAEVAALLEAVDAVAEIPRAIRAGATVTRRAAG